MTFGIIGNTAKPIIKDVLIKLTSFFQSRGLAFIVHDVLAEWLKVPENKTSPGEIRFCGQDELVRNSDILIALGGDGTMLAATRLVGDRGVPILGVNLGKLGFLAEVSVDELEKCLDEILRNDYYVEKRTILEARSKYDGKSFHCLNDIVVDKGSSARMIDIETYVNGEYLITYRTDGIIVATPTGSTAYSLATGGPIVVPDSRVIMINPIAPHTLTARPVLVPDESVIKIVVKSGTKSVHLTADGQIEGFYDVPAEFTVKKAPYQTNLVKNKERTYYNLLRAKLLWGSDVRVGNKK